ncbi:MAG TPA: betaine--homocysteine S-methyltransferase [Chloroflexi bacterium]|nr:MAG: methionine synthase I [Anaerolineaceae bacterium 4572_5.1]HEY85016.1 betaine--homocysteine S-methyltransferase [Chloroflexota bacterium]
MINDKGQALIDQILEEDGFMVLDGGMGTLLMQAGLDHGNPPEEWNVIHPDRIRAIHKGYIEAGARLILTNTFGGTRFRLKLHNLQDRGAELNRAAAQLARAEADAASRPVIVAGSMGPTGEMLEPLGEMTFDEAKAAFAEQAAALAEGGADILWIETMSALDEVQAAVEGARSVCDLPLAATMTFDTNGHTMMGVSPVAALETLSTFNLLALGGNCGNGPAEIEGVISAMRQADPEVILIAKANAGLPRWVGDDLVYDGTPDVMADYAVRARDLGAKLIGSCCGSTPGHIKSMAEALANTPVGEARVAATEADVPEQEARNSRRSRRRNKRG